MSISAGEAFAAEQAKEDPDWRAKLQARPEYAKRIVQKLPRVVLPPVNTGVSGTFSGEVAARLGVGGVGQPATPKPKPKRKRRRQSRVAEWLLAHFAQDARNLDKSPADLARELGVAPSTISRALNHPEYKERFAMLREDRGLRPSVASKRHGRNKIK